MMVSDVEPIAGVQTAVTKIVNVLEGAGRRSPLC